MTDQERHLREMAREYLNIINLMADPMLIDSTSRQRLSADRTNAHEELIRITGRPRPFDMKQYCLDLLAGAARPIFADIAPA